MTTWNLANRSEGRPLEKALWAGAMDSAGGEALSWLTRTTMRHGSIAAYGNAGGAGNYSRR